jgi:hypothetical protein
MISMIILLLVEILSKLLSSVDIELTPALVAEYHRQGDLLALQVSS